MFDSALTLEQVKYVIKEEREAGLRNLPKRLEHAHRTGCSSRVPGMNLENCIFVNRQGPNNLTLPVDEFIARYLTFTKPAC